MKSNTLLIKLIGWSLLGSCLYANVQAMRNELPAAWLETDLTPIAAEELRSGYVNDAEYQASLHVLGAILTQQKRLMAQLRKDIESDDAYSDALAHVVDKNAQVSGLENYLLKCVADLPDERARIKLAHSLIKSRLSRVLKDSLWLMLAASFERERDNANARAVKIFNDVKTQLSTIPTSHLKLLRGYAYPLAAYNHAVKMVLHIVLYEFLIQTFEQSSTQWRRQKKNILAWYTRHQKQIDGLLITITALCAHSAEQKIDLD